MPNLKGVVAIINFWDCQELLPFAVKQWEKLGIDVMIVYSNVSNYRQILNNSAFLSRPEFKKCTLVKCEPLETLQPADNERRKRNVGLQRAREMEYTHFITADADEFYEPFDIDLSLSGTVVACKTYFASPTLTIGLDVTLVPFVHRITQTIEHRWNTKYPYAFVDGHIRIDPTRQMNITEGVHFNDKIVMHHLSWIRKDYAKKIYNSTARRNIERSSVMDDLVNAKPGYFCKFYGKTLSTAPNLFGITL